MIEGHVVLVDRLTHCCNDLIVLGHDGWMVDVPSAAELCECFAATLAPAVADVKAVVSSASKYTWYMYNTDRGLSGMNSMIIIRATRKLLKTISRLMV